MPQLRSNVCVSAKDFPVYSVTLPVRHLPLSTTSSFATDDPLGGLTVERIVGFYGVSMPFQPSFLEDAYEVFQWACILFEPSQKTREECTWFFFRML